ncbi:MAG TPA: DUF5985 family protein [Chthoniobacteraceae bacterium]|nr:DUF5985 family protein [Chthoniobacteraceae bacterium]
MQIFKITLFIMAILTSLGCTVLLFRGHRRRRVKLLMWSAICFAALTVTNGLLFLDLIILPGVDLRILRLSTALAGMFFLLYGFIWDSE